MRRSLISLGGDLSFDLAFSARARAVGASVATAIALAVTTVSVALTTSIELASRSASDSARDSIHAVQGMSQIEVVAGDTGIAEEWIDTIRGIPGVASASPVVERAVRPIVAGAIGEQIQLLGIDILSDRDPRDFSVVREGYRQRDLSQFSAGTAVAVIPVRLAERLRLAEGDALRVRDLDREIRFTIGGTLGGRLSEAFDGNVALVDWRAAQNALGLRGRVSRVDIVLEEVGGVAEAIELLQSRIGSVASVRKAGHPDRFLEGMFRVYQTGMWAVAAIGVLVALLLYFSISASSVDRKSDEFRVLHAVGVSLSRLRRLAVLEAVIIGAGAVGLGLAFAPLLAELAVERLSSASRLIHGSGIALRGLGWWSVGVAVGTAALVLGVATVGPALLAVRRAGQSAEALDKSHQTARAGSWRLWPMGLIGIGFLAPAFVGAEGSTGSFLLAIIGGAIVIEVACIWLFDGRRSFLPPLLAVLMPRVGPVVASAIKRRPLRLATTAAIWAVSLGGVGAVLSTLEGVSTGIHAANSSYRGGASLIGFAGDPERTSSVRSAAVSPGVLDKIRSVPGVEEAAALSVGHVTVGSEDVMVYSVPAQVLARRRSLTTRGDDASGSLTALQRGECLVSKGFSERLRLSVGDALSLATPSGTVRCRVAGLGNSFRGGLPVVEVDERVFREWFDHVGINVVYVWGTQAAENLHPRLEQDIRPEKLFFAAGAPLEDQPRRILATRGLAVAVVMTCLVGMGILGLLALADYFDPASLDEEIALIRVVGGTSRTIMAAICGGTLVVGAAGSIAGALLSVAWARSFAASAYGAAGWNYPWAVDLTVIGTVTAMGFLLSGVAGLGCFLLVRTKEAGRS